MTTHTVTRHRLSSLQAASYLETNRVSLREIPHMTPMFIVLKNEVATVPSKNIEEEAKKKSG